MTISELPESGTSAARSLVSSGEDISHDQALRSRSVTGPLTNEQREDAAFDAWLTARICESEGPVPGRGRPRSVYTLSDVMLTRAVDHLVHTRDLSVNGACRVIAAQRRRYRPVSSGALRQRYYRAQRRKPER